MALLDAFRDRHGQSLGQRAYHRHCSLIAVFLSLEFVVPGTLHVPINGSVPLFMMGVCLYLFFATAIGIFLAAVARTMPQLGLLYMLAAMPMNILSGSNTPLDSQPAWLQTIMQASPSTHFVSFAQAILYRGADFQDVWPRFLAVGLIGALFLAIAACVSDGWLSRRFEATTQGYRCGISVCP